MNDESSHCVERNTLGIHVQMCIVSATQGSQHKFPTQSGSCSYSFSWSRVYSRVKIVESASVVEMASSMSGTILSCSLLHSCVAARHGSGCVLEGWRSS